MAMAGFIATAAIAEAQLSPLALFGFTNSWRYNQTTSYDGVNWTAVNFDDSALPVGRGVLAQEDSNVFVTSRTNTVLALGRLTYYFRTTFVFTGHIAGVSLTFSNIVDDGAVFYLNGREVSRFSIAPAPAVISYATTATSHEATGVDVFTLSGPLIETNLVSGTNVLAVEVHQQSAGSSDIVWGCALTATLADTNPPPTLRMPPEPPTYGYQLVNAFGSLSFPDPVAIATPPGETNRIFVVEQDGRISVITNLAAPTRTVFLDITSRVVGGTPTDERGLLGMAFHPGYATNRKFYVFYTVNATTAQGANTLHDRLSQMLASATNPNTSDPTSELVLFEQYDEAGNHNGGCLQFGPDGYLYISLGDEGGGNDQYQNSQRIDRDFFAGVMRIDVETNRPGSLMPNPHPANTNNPAREIRYRIPADNPWIGATSFNGSPVNPANVRTEFYAVGLRNPWRFSFDAATGDLYLADVGQSANEEVNIIRRGGNYGWNYREGILPGPRGNPPAGVVFDGPIAAYARSLGASVTGGVVYRGSRFPSLAGAYLFADYVSGNVWMLHANGTNVVPITRITGDNGIAGFGTDPRNGDVLTADQSEDTIKRVVNDTNTVSGTLPPTLADTGAFTNLTSLTNETQVLPANAGVIPYDLNVPFWSDGAHKSRWLFMATNGAKIGFAPEGNWSLPAGMAWVKHFDLEITNGEPSSARRLETRILVRNASGVYGVTYRWGNSLTNATLVPEEGLDESFTIYDGPTVRTQVWHYPSRAECQTCHTPQGGWALGFNTVQMNRDIDYGGATSNQIAAMSAAGYFTSAVSNVHSLRALSPATNDAASREWRVRSFLAVNCAQCHQPGGSALGSWNASITNFTADAGLIHGALVNNGGNTNARVIVPGSLTNSMLLSRVSIRGPGQMPPLASSVVDAQAVELLSAWITNDLAGGWTNSIDPLSILAVHTNGSAAVQFTQPANRAHRVETATNLNSPIAWQFLNVPENRPTYPSSNTAVTVTDSSTNSAQKFYRVRVSTP